MKEGGWSKNQEIAFKQIIKKFFDDKISNALKTAKNPLKIGDDLSTILKDSDAEVVRMITPRAIKKWASPATLSKWEKIMEDPRMLAELRIIGKSIANTMRPLAGNNFSLWVAKILNTHFSEKKIGLKAITSGKIKSDMTRDLVIKSKKRAGTTDYKPDIDIILVKTSSNEPIAIISAKTTLAERVMQTISWSRFLKNVPKKYNGIKLFLVTAWDTFESGANKERVQELDGVYVCNRKVREYGNIKLFSKIVEDIKDIF